MSESLSKAPNERLSALNSWISRAIIKSGDGLPKAHYDRSAVATRGYAEVQFRGVGADVTIPHRDELRKGYEADNSGKAVGGTCRELAQWAVVNLKREGLVDEAEVYACATDTEAHYVVAATIDGERYLVDIAYSQPVLEAIPVDGEDHISLAYAGEKGTKQAFSGEITYKAQETDEGIMFTIESPGKSTQFPLMPLTDELDAKIPAKWLVATGKVYATNVVGNADGSYRVDEVPTMKEADMKWDLGILHQIAAAHKEAVEKAVRVHFRNR